MKRNRFSGEENIFDGAAHQQFLSLNRGLRELRDAMPGLHRGLNVPVPRGGSRTIKGSRTQTSIFARAGTAAFGNFLSQDVLSGAGSNIGSFYTSSTQSASDLYDTLMDGQRIL